MARLGEHVDVEGWSEVRCEDGGSERLRGALPADLPAGYHTLVAADGRERPLVLSPGRCFLPPNLKTWGWAVQLYSLRSRTSWGTGDLCDLRALGRWARPLGAGALLVNPLHAAMPGPAQQPSPYFPSSRCFRNPLYLCVDELPGADAAGVRALADRARELNARQPIDRDAVYDLKMAALEHLQPPAGAGADSHGSAERLLRDYATFVALAEQFGGGPVRWPEGFETPASPRVGRWRRDNLGRVRLHMWIQETLERQFAAAASEIGIVNDLAIGIDPQGADAWMWRGVFAPGMRVGAPPDEFNTAGQDWGLPPLDPWRLRATGYDSFIRTVAAAMRHAAGLRVDHVMGLFRLYWIPDGAPPTEGAYVRYPYRALLDVLALESHRAGAFVVGEDLGTVEPVVRDEMRARQMLSYRLLWFEDSAPSEYPELALAAVTNHDLPTIAGMWTGSDLETQFRLGLDPNVESTQALRARLGSWIGSGDVTVDEVIERTYRLLSEAPSALLVGTLEDAAAQMERPNMPGTVSDHPNWSRPLPLTLEELQEHPRPRAIACALGRR